MSKAKELAEALELFKVEHGRPATAIYLGWKTRRELFMNVEIRGYLSYAVGEDPRPKFDGVAVYSVDAAEHFGIA